MTGCHDMGHSGVMTQTDTDRVWRVVRFDEPSPLMTYEDALEVAAAWESYGVKATLVLPSESWSPDA